MNKFIASATLALLAFVGYHNALYYSDLLNIVPRYEDGTLLEDVTDHQTNHDTGIVHVAAVKANMDVMEWIVACTKSEGQGCRAASLR